MRPDARPQARKYRRRIHWNTLRIFLGRERRRWLQIVRRSRTVNVGHAPKAVNEREDRGPLERAVLSGNVRQIQGKVSPVPLHRKEIRHVIITTT